MGSSRGLSPILVACPTFWAHMKRNDSLGFLGGAKANLVAEVKAKEEVKVKAEVKVKVEAEAKAEIKAKVGAKEKSKTEVM